MDYDCGGYGGEGVQKSQLTQFQISDFRFQQKMVTSPLAIPKFYKK